MNSVWYNDWRQVDVASLDGFAPTRPVSVIIPYYQTPAETLARTLATLEGQTYLGMCKGFYRSVGPTNR